MVTFRMRYVQAYADRHGRPRYYYRRPGFPRVALSGEPGSTEFAKAYETAAAQAPRKIGEDQVIAGTFNALIADYYETTAYRKNKDITRRTYRNALERFRQTFGPTPMKQFDAERLDRVLDAFAHKPGSQDTLRKVLRLILKLAKRRGLITVNPMDDVRLSRKPIVGFKPWSDADVEAFEAKWKSGTRERLALAMLLYTLQRRADVVTLGRQHTKPGAIHVVQSKSNGETRLWLPIHAHLQAELDRVPAGQLTFLQTQWGRPFTVAGFGNWFRDACMAAGLTDKRAHGLRKTGSRRLAEGGATAHQIMAVTGHKNLSEVTLYTASADQERLAVEAFKRAEGGTKSSTP